MRCMVECTPLGPWPLSSSAYPSYDHPHPSGSQQFAIKSLVASSDGQHLKSPCIVYIANLLSTWIMLRIVMEVVCTSEATHILQVNMTNLFLPCYIASSPGSSQFLSLGMRLPCKYNQFCYQISHSQSHPFFWQPLILAFALRKSKINQCHRVGWGNKRNYSPNVYHLWE